MTATISTLVTVYQYSPRNLILAYGLALAFALLAAAIGALAIRANGTSYDKSFSTILGVTRNPALDDLHRSNDKGIPPVNELDKNTKLRFGAFQVAGKNERRIVLGLENDVEELRPRREEGTSPHVANEKAEAQEATTTEIGQA